MPVDPKKDTAEYCLPPSSQSSSPPPPSAPVRVDLGALSHPGKVRPNNEDFYIVGRTARSLETLLTNLPAGEVPQRSEDVGYGMVVADGMGGMAAGEVASRTAIRTLVQLLLNTANWIMRIDERNSERLMQRIAGHYRTVDAVLHAEGQTDPQLTGMGTTMTLAYSLGTDLFVGHVGDSRIYFCRGAECHQLTRDHTFAQALADLGAIRAEEVATHRLRHVLTRALGTGQGWVEADVQHVCLHDGDQVLLCTDGLTDMVDGATIASVLRQARTSSAACQALVDLALKAGGKDNVTVVVARYQLVREP
jgi:protein phosphatase